jgi:hypothetical protein
MKLKIYFYSVQTKRLASEMFSVAKLPLVRDTDRTLDHFTTETLHMFYQLSRFISSLKVKLITWVMISRRLNE